MNKYLVAFLISMVPIIELRGGVPYAVTMGIPEWQAIIICAVANMLPVPLIYFFARKVLLWGTDKKYIGKFFTYCVKKGERGGQKLMKKGPEGLFVGLMLFVAIPIPGTGAWTGTLAASFVNMGFKRAVLAVSLGVVIAGIIMMIASSGVLAAIGL